MTGFRAADNMAPALRQRVGSRSLELGGERASASLSSQETDFVRRILEGDSLETAYVAAGLLEPPVIQGVPVQAARRVVRTDAEETPPLPASVEEILEAATDLMGEPRVLRYFALLQKAQRARIRVSMTPERWIAALECIATADVRLLVDANGAGLPPHMLPERIAKAVKEVERRTDAHGNTVWKYKFEDRLSALELLARHMGLLQADRTNESDVEEARRTLVWRYVHHLHWGEGLTVAEALEMAERNPQAVTEWGRARGFLQPVQVGG